MHLPPKEIVMTSPALMKRVVPADSLPRFAVDLKSADDEFVDIEATFEQVRDALLAAALNELAREFENDNRWSVSTRYAAARYIEALILDENMDRQSRYLENEQREVLKRLFAKMVWSFRELFLAEGDVDEFKLIPGTHDRWFGEYYKAAGVKYPNLYAYYPPVS
jgi:hypothetical protein